MDVLCKRSDSAAHGIFIVYGMPAKLYIFRSFILIFTWFGINGGIGRVSVSHAYQNTATTV